MQSIIVDDEISCSSFVGACDCKRSTILDENHGHIIIGDSRLIANTSKGTNYRETNTINHSKCKNAIDFNIKSCIENSKLCTSLETMI